MPQASVWTAFAFFREVFLSELLFPNTLNLNALRILDAAFMPRKEPPPRCFRRDEIAFRDQKRAPIYSLSRLNWMSFAASRPPEDREAWMTLRASVFQLRRIPQSEKDISDHLAL